MAGKRLAFWGAVAGVSVISHFALQVLADKVPNTGLAKLVHYTHRGGN